MSEGLDAFREFAAQARAERGGRISRKEMSALWAAHKAGEEVPASRPDESELQIPSAEQVLAGTSDGSASPEDVALRTVLRQTHDDDQESAKGGVLTLDPLAWFFETVFDVIDAMTGRTGIWKVTPADGKRMGRAWINWVKSLPKKQRIPLEKITKDVVPTLSLIAVFAGIIAPRFQATQQLKQRRIAEWMARQRETHPGYAPRPPAGSQPDTARVPEAQPHVRTFKDNGSGGPHIPNVGGDPFADLPMEEVMKQPAEEPDAA